VLLLVLCLLGGPGGDWLTPDEVSIAKLGRSAQSGPRVLFSVLNQLDRELYLFDFETGRARQIVDGRMNFFLPFFVGHDTGFSILTAVGRPILYSLDRDGNLRDTRRRDDCLALDAGARISHLTEHGGRLLATVVDRGAQRLLLMALSLETCETEVLHRRETGDDFRRFWESLDGRLFLITKETGEVLAVDPARGYAEGTVVRQGLEALPRPEGMPGRYPYLTNLTDANRVDRVLVFAHMPLRDTDGKARETFETRALLFDGERFEDSGDYLLGVHEGKRLVYVLEDGELALKPHDN